MVMFTEHGDAAAVLDPAATAEAYALWEATVGATGTIRPEQLRSLAMLHLCRFQADVGNTDAFATAMNLFQELLRGRPDLVPAARLTDVAAVLTVTEVAGRDAARH
ncbi:hypothetical protein [Dactylosporangium sp. NPDC005555]|uniref:hypothetical protein n=1 Tax=Dactylosporangium sp. NPDC005555 TaxID=3154889 RepID=UPI0033B09C90